MAKTAKREIVIIFENEIYLYYFMAILFYFRWTFNKPAVYRNGFEICGQNTKHRYYSQAYAKCYGSNTIAHLNIYRHTGTQTWKKEENRKLNGGSEMPKDEN